MEKFDSKEEFIKHVAEELTTGFMVHYDADRLQYVPTMENEYGVDDYDDYLELSDEEFEKIPAGELSEFDRDRIRSLREANTCKSFIEAPPSFIHFEWMADFVDDHSNHTAFFRRAERALNNRHPFSGFKDQIHYYGLQDEWYSYQLERMIQYVRHEIYLEH